VVERVAFQSEPGERVVAVVVRSETATGRLPAVIVQHWLGGSKDEFLLQALLWQLATRGYLAVAIDGRYRGERGGTRGTPSRVPAARRAQVRQREGAEAAEGSGRGLQEAMTEALRTGKGHPWLIDTVYDVLRTLDYLETREDVDRDRIGMTGISEGGLETWMAAAADPRIRVAAPVVGVSRFRDMTAGLSTSAGEARVNLFRPVLEAFAKQEGSEKIDETLARKAWDRLLPGFSDRFDADRIVPLIAPRPLLILSHEKDELIPLAGAEAVYAAARERYRALNAEDRLRLRIAPGLSHSGQDLTEVAALFEWFDRWLKPPPAKS
jgi:dienelactone hydrolase